jgi:hypothetical protein
LRGYDEFSGRAFWNDAAIIEKMAIPHPLKRFVRICISASIACVLGLPIAAVPARGQEPAPAPNPDDITPPWGTFPKPGAGIELAGELVAVDHVNRRFGLRLDGDFNKYRYFADAKLKATLLPYGEVWYHGAPADLADIPLGTRLQGRFLLPPKDAPPRQLTSDHEKAFPPPLHDRALVVEDGFSHERRRGRAFRIDKLEIKRDEYVYGDLKFAIDRGPIVLTQVKASGQPLDGPPDTPKDAAYTVDFSTRVWKDGRPGALADLAVGQIVQANLGWSPEWGNRQFHCLDIWIDDASCQVAIEQQRQAHLRRMRHYWLPAWIDKVEYEPDGSGMLTVTYFSGMDRQLYDEIQTKDPYRRLKRADHRVRIIGGSQGDGGVNSHVQKVHVDPAPPPGSSGITHEVRVGAGNHEEGLRPGRFIRVSQRNWPGGILPPEWLLPFPFPAEKENPLD